MDLTAATADLAKATADVTRLLPSRSLDPVLTGLLLQADADGLVLAGTDREHGVRLACPATVHTDGAVLVPAKPLADTVRALEVEQVRLVVEGSRLAVRTPGARYALPLLEVDLHPGVPEPPRLVGTVHGRTFVSTAATVAATASRDDALPLFTGVRVRSDRDRLRLVATDRYKMAVATLPWQAEGVEVDALIPAALLTEVARQAVGAQRIALHVDTDRAALAWDCSVVSTALLAAPFVDERKFIPSTMDASVELDADELAGAVRRVSLFTDVRGPVSVDLGDGEVRVRGTSAQLGEAQEAVKASVDGGINPVYQSRYLLDALKAFAGRRVRIGLLAGLRPSVLTAIEGGDVDLRYVVMPIRPQAS